MFPRILFLTAISLLSIFPQIVFAQGSLQLSELLEKVVDVRIEGNEQYTGVTAVEVEDGSEASSISRLKVRLAIAKRLDLFR